MPRKCHLRWAGCRTRQMKCKSIRPTEELARVDIGSAFTNQYEARGVFFRKRESGGKVPPKFIRLRRALSSHCRSDRKRGQDSTLNLHANSNAHPRVSAGLFLGGRPGQPQPAAAWP